MSDAHLLEAITARPDDVVHVLRSEPDVAVEFVSPSVHALVSNSRHDRPDHRSFPGTMGRDP